MACPRASRRRCGATGCLRRLASRGAPDERLRRRGGSAGGRRLAAYDVSLPSRMRFGAQLSHTARSVDPGSVTGHGVCVEAAVTTVGRLSVVMLLGVMWSSSALAQVTPAAGYTPPDDTPTIRLGLTLYPQSVSYTHLTLPTSDLV